MPPLLSVPVREAGGAVLGFLRMVREAGGGHWITLHGDEEEGGGVHVFVGAGGQITKGPASLIGAKAGHITAHHEAQGGKVTHHPDGHTPKGATDHPAYEEKAPGKGKPYARTESARDTGLTKEQAEAGLHKAIAEKKAATSKATPAAESPSKGPRTVIAPEELDYQTAYNAHAGTSHVPDERAKQEQERAAQDVQSFYEDMLKKAANDQQRAILDAEIETYKQGFLTRWSSILHRRAGIYSSMISGPSNFPAARMQKKNEADRRATTEFMDWRKHAQAAISKKIAGARGSAEIANDDARVLGSDVQRSLKTIHAIDSRDPEWRGFDKTAFVNSIVTKTATAARAGKVDAVQHAHDLVRAHNDAHDKPAITARHAFWGLVDVAKRNAAGREPSTAQPEEQSTLGDYGHGKVVLNPEADRVQIIFHGKPDEDTRAALRGAGWNWSPSNGAWQRKMTENAKYSARHIMERHAAKQTGGAVRESIPVRETCGGAALGFLRPVREARKSTKGKDSSTERHTPDGARWITVHPNGDDGHGQPVLISGSGQVLGGMGGKFNGQHIGDVAGWKQAGTAKPEGYGTGGTHAGYNQHLATYGGAKAIADVTVHGQPVKHAGGTFSVHVAGGRGVEKTLNQHGQGQTAGGAFLEKHPNGGVIYHGGMGAPDTWHDFAKHMSEDLLTHSAEHEHRRMMGRADTGSYKDEHEAEGHAYRKAAMKQVRDYIRAEGGIRAGRTRTVGQELRGQTARSGDEYRHQLPSWAKNANGKHTTDQMARLVGDTFPHLGIETEDDLREYLMGHERQRKADAAAEAKVRAAKAATAQPATTPEPSGTQNAGPDGSAKKGMWAFGAGTGEPPNKAELVAKSKEREARAGAERAAAHTRLENAGKAHPDLSMGEFQALPEAFQRHAIETGTPHPDYRKPAPAAEQKAETPAAAPPAATPTTFKGHDLANADHREELLTHLNNAVGKGDDSAVDAAATHVYGLDKGGSPEKIAAAHKALSAVDRHIPDKAAHDPETAEPADEQQRIQDQLRHAPGETTPAEKRQGVAAVKASITQAQTDLEAAFRVAKPREHLEKRLADLNHEAHQLRQSLGLPHESAAQPLTPPRPTWDTAPRGEEGDYQNGHLRFNRQSWQTFAVDHPASIAEYNRLHGEGKRDTPYDPSQHHVIHPLTGSAGDHPVAAPQLASKAAVAEQSKYIKRGSYSPEQQAAVEHLNKQKVKPPAADAVPLFADLAVKDRAKPTEKETKRREGGLFAGIRESRVPVRETAGGAVLH